MNEKEAMRIAEPIIEKVVDLLSEKRYDDILNVTELEDLSISDIREIVDGYLDINELDYIDKYKVLCEFNPNYSYNQLTVGIYNDNSGFYADYDLTTNSKLNDLTLQMEFIFVENGDIRSRIIDIHVL